MVCVAENFEGTAELLGAKGGVESEEDLDHGDRPISAIFDCTHLELCFNCFSMVLDSNSMCKHSRRGLRALFSRATPLWGPRAGQC